MSFRVFFTYLADEGSVVENNGGGGTNRYWKNIISDTGNRIKGFYLDVRQKNLTEYDIIGTSSTITEFSAIPANYMNFVKTNYNPSINPSGYLWQQVAIDPTTDSSFLSGIKLWVNNNEEYVRGVFCLNDATAAELEIVLHREIGETSPENDIIGVFCYAGNQGEEII